MTRTILKLTALTLFLATGTSFAKDRGITINTSHVEYAEARYNGLEADGVESSEAPVLGKYSAPINITATYQIKGQSPETVGMDVSYSPKSSAINHFIGRCIAFQRCPGNIQIYVRYRDGSESYFNYFPTDVGSWSKSKGSGSGNSYAMYGIMKAM